MGECRSRGGQDLLDKEAEGEKGSKSTNRLWIAELEEVWKKKVNLEGLFGLSCS